MCDLVEMYLCEEKHSRCSVEIGREICSFIGILWTSNSLVQLLRIYI